MVTPTGPSAGREILSSLPSTCAVAVPQKDDTVSSYLGARWMDLGPESTLPFATASPTTEADVVAAVKLAASHGLQILPACGQCGSVVRTHDRILYLNMRPGFTGVSVDAGARTVTFGGGALTKEVQPVVTAAGFYTGWPNLGVVGLAGNVLGGGLNLFQGIKGYACDNLVAARLVTASGEIVSVSAESESSDERRLFHLLRGSGAGLAGVVLDLTLRIYPLSDISLPSSPEAGGNQIPGQSGFFAPDQWDAVIDEVWDRLASHISSSPANGAMIIMPAPPFLPKDKLPTPNSPVILLSAEYPGNAADANAFFSSIFSPEVRSRTLLPIPESAKLTPVVTMNAMRDATMGKGKIDGRPGDCFNALMSGMSADAIKRIAAGYTERLASAPDGAVVGRAMTVLAPTPVKAQVAAEQDSIMTGMSYRDRGYMIQIAWTVGDENGTDTSALEWGSRALELAREEDRKAGVADAVLAGNSRRGVPIEQILTPSRLEAWKAVKAKWDPTGVFWHPAVHGWA